VTSVEQRAVVEAARSAGARDAFVIIEPFAAAVGSGLPVMDATGSMVVDIGGGTTDVVTISLGGIVAQGSVAAAGDAMNVAIANYIREKFGVAVGESTAERLKIEIGSASVEASKELSASTASGRSLNTGNPTSIEISSEDIAKALQSVVSEIINIIKETLEKTPPDLAADVVARGIVITGGGALLRNIGDVIYQATNITTLINPQNALDAVAIGTGEALQISR
jgi:rod shape-determining protein MreB